MSYLISAWRSIWSRRIASVSGPIDDPSPNTSSVTPGRDRETRHVDLAVASISDRRHDRGDQIAINRDIGRVRWTALAVINGAPADDDVVHRAAILRG